MTGIASDNNQRHREEQVGMTQQRQKNPKIDFLKGYLEAQRRIEAKNIQIEELYDAMMPRAQLFGEAPSGGRGVDMCGRFGDIFDLFKDVEKEIADLKQKRTAVISAINAVPDTEMRTVLECRYISGMGWGKIAKTIQCDTSTAWRIHGRALGYIIVPTDRDKQAIQ